MECCGRPDVVAHKVEAVGDVAALVQGASEGGAGGHVLGLVGVGGLVAVNMGEPLHVFAEGGEEGLHRRRLLGVRLWVRPEAPIRIQALLVPPLHPLVSPRRHAGYHHDVERGDVIRGAGQKEEDGALDSRGLVSVHTPGHEHRRPALHPLPRDGGQQREIVGAGRQRAILDHVEHGRVGGPDLLHHLREVRALLASLVVPLQLLGGPPGLADRADPVLVRGHRLYLPQGLPVISSLAGSDGIGLHCGHF
mmetsp:Transcript_3053/g.6424  ORF Transcript_3053/g.6424 Transcript_3053/m.6424 type:complete len:250 (-) Transcript_3053:8-757(-)